MRVISMILADKEVARVEEGQFKNLIEIQNRFVPNNVFSDWYDDCFYGIKNSSTFDDRFRLVKENNYFCYSKPELKLIARTLEEVN